MDWRQKQALDHYITDVPEPTDEKCSCGHMDYDHEWDETGEDSAGYTYCLVEDCDCKQFTLAEAEPDEDFEDEYEEYEDE